MATQQKNTDNKQPEGSNMNKQFDKYDLQARIYPAILVLIPLGLFFFCLDAKNTRATKAT